ncbi:MAG: radical SAM protein [Candidatus Omnitrophota bacterium]
MFLSEITQSQRSWKTVYISFFNATHLENFDFILLGEAERIFDVFLRKCHYTSIQEKIFCDSQLVDLNDLPNPDKSLFERYVNHKDSYLVITSKGCPDCCSYCMETVLKDQMGINYCRRRSPMNVIAELIEAKSRYGIREVIFKDSIFSLNKDWLREYLPLYREHINVPYKCFAKASNFDVEIAEMLKESQCYCVEFGIQTFNEQLKHGVLDRNESITLLLEAFEICDRYHLDYDADHLFGIPGESLEDHLTAANFYIGLQHLNRIKCHNLVFYPNAKISQHSLDSIRNDKGSQVDFFSSVAGSFAMYDINACFQKYFKVLPLFTDKINSFLQKGDHWKIFKFIPNILIIFLMFILAVRNNDKRFGIYVKHYLKKIVGSIIEL